MQPKETSLQRASPQKQPQPHLEAVEQLWQLIIADFLVFHVCCVYSGQTVSQGDGLGLNHVGFLKALVGFSREQGTDPSALGVHPVWALNPRII